MLTSQTRMQIPAMTCNASVGWQVQSATLLVQMTAGAGNSFFIKSLFRSYLLTAQGVM